MIRKLAAAVLAVSIVPAAAFACGQHTAAAAKKAELNRPQQQLVVAQADTGAVKKETASMTAQTASTKATASSTNTAAAKKMKPKAKSLSQPKAAVTK